MLAQNAGRTGPGAPHPDRGEQRWQPRHAARPLGEEGLARSPEGEEPGGPGLGLARPCPSHPRAWGPHPGGHPGSEAPQDGPPLLLLLRPGWPGQDTRGAQRPPGLAPSHGIRARAKTLLRIPASENRGLCGSAFHELFCKRGRRGGCAFPVLSLPWKRVPPRVFQGPLVCFKPPLVCFKAPLIRFKDLLVRFKAPLKRNLLWRLPRFPGAHDVAAPQKLPAHGEPHPTLWTSSHIPQAYSSCWGPGGRTPPDLFPACYEIPGELAAAAPSPVTRGCQWALGAGSEQLRSSCVGCPTAGPGRGGARLPH